MSTVYSVHYGTLGVIGHKYSDFRVLRCEQFILFSDPADMSNSVPLIVGLTTAGCVLLIIIITVSVVLVIRRKKVPRQWQQKECEEGIPLKGTFIFIMLYFLLWFSSQLYNKYNFADA